MSSSEEIEDFTDGDDDDDYVFSEDEEDDEEYYEDIKYKKGNKKKDDKREKYAKEDDEREEYEKEDDEKEDDKREEYEKEDDGKDDTEEYDINDVDEEEDKNSENEEQDDRNDDEEDEEEEEGGELRCQFFKSKRGAMKLHIKGFSYDKNRFQNDRFYWICELRYDRIYKCNSTVITTPIRYNSEKHVVVKGPRSHNHEPSPLRKDIAEFCDNLKQIASESVKRPCKLLKDNLPSTSSDIREYLPTKQALNQMIYRTQKKPDHPLNINIRINEKNTKLFDKNFVIKDQRYDNATHRIILLSSPKMMSLLSSASYWILDSAFHIIASIFQLYTIHGNINFDYETTFPLLFCLCSNKDKRAYKLLFELISDYGKENNLSFTPKVCILNFEIPAISSARAHFEDVFLHGCNFDFRQKIYKKIHSSRLGEKYATNQRFNIDMKCLLALSYLPVEEIPIYFYELLESLQDTDSKLISVWFKETYVSGTSISEPMFSPDFWSCHFVDLIDIPKTQTSAEAWNHHINRIIDRKRSGFDTLIQELIKECTINDAEIDKVMNGEPSLKKLKGNIQKDARIEKILEIKEQLPKVTFLIELAKNLHL